MTWIDKLKSAEQRIIERKLGMMRRQPMTFGTQVVASNQMSELERHPSQMVTSPIDLDPASPTFGQSIFIVGAPTGGWI